MGLTTDTTDNLLIEFEVGLKFVHLLVDSFILRHGGLDLFEEFLDAERDFGVFVPLFCIQGGDGFGSDFEQFGPGLHPLFIGDIAESGNQLRHASHNFGVGPVEDHEPDADQFVGWRCDLQRGQRVDRGGIEPEDDSGCILIECVGPEDFLDVQDLGGTEPLSLQ